MDTESIPPKPAEKQSPPILRRYCIVDATNASPYDTSMLLRRVVADYESKADAVRHLKQLIEHCTERHFGLLEKRGRWYSYISLELAE